MTHWRIRLLAIVAVIVLLLTVSPGSAFSAESITADTTETTDDFEEDLSGFGEVEGEAGFGKEPEVDLSNLDLETDEGLSDRMWHIGGFFKEDIGYSYAHEDDQPEFSKIQSILNLRVDFKLTQNWRARAVWNGFYDHAYSYFGRDEFTEETLETNEMESEIRDCFIDGAIFKWLRLKFGRQIIAWGQSEVDQITDVANPRDNRELGIVDLEDARIPVLATKVSLLFGTLETSLVAIHENRPNKTPAAGSEFDPLSRLRSQFTIADEEIPENNVENTEYLLRIFKLFNGGDLGLIWADVYNDSYHLDFESYNALTQQLTLTPRHRRMEVLGLSANRVIGSWLFKTELARKTGVVIQRNEADLQSQLTTLTQGALLGGQAVYDRESDALAAWSQKDLLQAMLGFEYSGINDLTVALEGSLEKIEAYEKNLGSDETTGSVTLHLGYAALNNTLNADVYWFHLTDENGDVYRINCDYDIMDALNIAGGLILYEAEKETAQVYPFRKNDRLFASLKYSF